MGVQPSRFSQTTTIPPPEVKAFSSGESKMCTSQGEMLAVSVRGTALQSGSRKRLRIGAALAVAGGAVLLTGWLVVTSGERARQVVLDLVAAAQVGDVPAALALFAFDAGLSLGSPSNPAYASDAIRLRVEQLDNRYRIESNEITLLEAQTETWRRATVRLGCRTVPVRGFGPVPTQWEVRVERQDDGSWRITHLTWLSIAGRAPTPNLGL